jgi:hypothetical protein
MLTPQRTGGVHIQFGLPLLKEDYERQANRSFSSSHCEDEKKHYLTVRLSPPGARCNERQAARIEHDLNAHEREDEVTPRD